MKTAHLGVQSFRTPFLALALLCSVMGTDASAETSNVGFERLMLPGNPGAALGVWYPTSSAAPEEPNTPFRQALALNAPPAGRNLPLVVISHGDGGWMGSHANTAYALARAGYVAAALEHVGNNSEDESASPAEWVVSRPAEISQSIDYLLTEWPSAAILDSDSIGAFGFSAGGYTALAAAGADPDFTVSDGFCADNPTEHVCATGMLEEIGNPPGLDNLTPDSRITAISAAAPAFGFALDSAPLVASGVSVQLWSGALDDRVPHATNGAVIAGALPDAEVHVIENAGHFAFLGPCNPRLEEVNPRIWQMVCVDAEVFDRAEFQKDFNRRLIAFFDTAFGR